MGFDGLQDSIPFIFLFLWKDQGSSALLHLLRNHLLKMILWKSQHMLGFWYQTPQLVLLLERVVQLSLIFSHNLERESSCHAIMNSSLGLLIGLSWYLVQSMKY
ncbi:uncharacterized protein [Cicer arietinum]|uniref:Uncharacterized protein LOC113784526 n=1 Tax=Cicer arietinum TaxID=3827 RepID=A0A3Q7XRW2_CICAR|nr:uncharacterized protein LOC113784526 [Cicer arietinum]